MKLYGGFEGNETMLDERDPQTNMTMLSADLENDDLPGVFESNRTDNLDNVMIIEATITPATMLDGFTISGGHADVSCGSAFNEGWNCRVGGIFSLGSPTIRNCHITQNFPSNHGEGLLVGSLEKI